MKMSKKKSVGWLSTGNGEGSLGLLKKGIELVNENKIEIKYIFTNRESGEKKGSDRFIDFAKSNNIKVISYSSQKYKKIKNSDWKNLRKSYDQEVLKKINPFKVDFIVAAGYMLFSPIICQHYKILNIHPALPDGPKGTWKTVIKELIKIESKFSGVSLHLMTPDLDEGPNLSFCKFSINDNNLHEYWEDAKKCPNSIEETKLFKKIREIIVKNERNLLLETLDKISSNEIDIDKPNQYDLSDSF